MKIRLGTPQATTATAHKLARIFYRLLRYGEAYHDPGMKQYEARYHDRILRNLRKRANDLGYNLVEKQIAAGVS